MMKTSRRNVVRIGAATIRVRRQDKIDRNCFDRLFDFCEAYLPGCGCDLVLLPETYEFRPGDVQNLNGPIARGFAGLAREHGLFLIAPIVEKAGDRFFITQAVFSPKGRLVHAYRKVHSLAKVSDKKAYLCGKRFSTFDLPWFKAGIMVCFDNQFPESSRTLAVKGAQVIFFPSFGDLHKPHRDAARCLDNHIYLVGSSVIDLAIDLPAERFEQGMVMDPKARLLASTCHKEGLAIADLPLKKGKLAQPELSGDTLSMPVNYLEWRRPEAYK